MVQPRPPGRRRRSSHTYSAAPAPGARRRRANGAAGSLGAAPSSAPTGKAPSLGPGAGTRRARGRLARTSVRPRRGGEAEPGGSQRPGETPRIIPSAEDPNEDIVERNIRIIVPLNNRENISDPTSPLRTNFVYHLSDVCKKCDPVEVELDNQIVMASQSNICDEESEVCYTYDRNKCYTNRVPFTYGGVTRMVETALTPDSCYPD